MRGGRRRLKHLILTLLSSKGPMTGAQLIREIEHMTQGFWKPSPGAIYPALDKLLEEGLVSIAKVEGTQKYYQITSLGREFLSPKHQLDVIVEETLANLRFILENLNLLDNEEKERLVKELEEVVKNLNRS
ncbi:MAG: PadR family transcriptional regulator [Sulfolobus sp.]